MCGIIAFLGGKPTQETVKTCMKKLEPRGPDTSRTLVLSGKQSGKPGHTDVTLGFARLAINGLTPAGMQPFVLNPQAPSSPSDTFCALTCCAASAEEGLEGQARAPSVFAICNGEIYNYKALAARYGIPLQQGSSDCQVLCPLYEAVEGHAGAFARCLDGVFALVLVDEVRGRIVAMRDPFGVRPMYMARVGEGWVWASELKALACIPGVSGITRFQPGTARAWDLHTGVEIQEGTPEGEEAGVGTWFTPHWLKNPAYGPSAGGRASARAALRVSLDAAVRKRMLVSDVPVGCLLSGGLDSSLVAALAQRAAVAAGRPPSALHTFSIGMSGSSDLAHARLVATHIGSTHHEVVLTPQDFLDAIPEVVAAIESYDITSVRASVGNYLVSQYIKAKTDVVVVLNGDGSDEASGSYLYFYSAPSDEAFEAEVDRLLRDIHIFDVLRSDRSVAAHGLEPRTPFLDRQFVATYTSIATGHRRPVRVATVDAATGFQRPVAAEKQLLREAFDPSYTSSDVSTLGYEAACPMGEVHHLGPALKDSALAALEAGALPSGFPGTLLPPAVLWRRKEAFSDGVSSPEKSWYEVIQEHAAAQFPGGEAQWREACAVFPPGPTQPYTAESVWYRQIFESCYGPGATSTIAYFWLPRWSGGAKDPSARTLAVYAQDGPATPGAGEGAKGDAGISAVPSKVPGSLLADAPSTAAPNEQELWEKVAQGQAC